MHLEKFKNKKNSCPGEGDTPSTGPLPRALRPFGPHLVITALEKMKTE